MFGTFAYPSSASRRRGKHFQHFALRRLGDGFARFSHQLKMGGDRFADQFAGFIEGVGGGDAAGEVGDIGPESLVALFIDDRIFDGGSFDSQPEL